MSVSPVLIPDMGSGSKNANPWAARYMAKESAPASAFGF
jgi:hypothetical protein